MMIFVVTAVSTLEAFKAEVHDDYAPVEHEIDRIHASTEREALAMLAARKHWRQYPKSAELMANAIDE